MAKQDWVAQWIWLDRAEARPLHQTVEALREFELDGASSARLRITADTRYRVYVNGEWVGDGPSRAWPARYQYDELDVAPYLRPGANEIRVFAKFYGVGTFHQVPKQGGLLAQLDWVDSGGAVHSLGTDGAWGIRPADSWVRTAPRQSVQMGVFEVYDARRADAAPPFESPKLLYPPEGGPWKNLHPRDVALLTKEPFNFVRALRPNVIAASPPSFLFPTAQYIYGNVVHSNNHVAVTGLYATTLRLDVAASVRIEADGNTVYVDGARGKDNLFELEAGEHFVGILLTRYFSHWRQATKLLFEGVDAGAFRNPVDGGGDRPWCFVPFEDAKFQPADFTWALMTEAERDAAEDRIDAAIDAHRDAAKDVAVFRAQCGEAAQHLGWNDGYVTDTHELFRRRAVVADASPLVDDPNGLRHDNAVCTTVRPSAEGDVELVYDLGEQNCGYWEFDIDAEAGLAVDVFAVENISPDGRVQHTQRYRNGMRYLCREGRNQFISYFRRSGRYLFIALRNQTAPVDIRLFRVVESTYPVDPIGSFSCSDTRLDKIWEISARTLKLCMEDTFTDCPLYEQTLWVGDARNEALFAYTAFDARDIARRCIRLAAYSLDQYPIVLSQVPSTWERLLPAWSFLWNISVWDYYWHSGDAEFVGNIYPYMVKNLQGAARFSDERGLFSAPFWNMFDWAGIDDNHRTVTHNSMFVIGAIDATLRCAEALGIEEDRAWLEEYREKLLRGVEGLWDPMRGVYPDSVHDDGSLSPRTSMHPHFLALLYDAAPDARDAQLLELLAQPPAEMTQVGSPFAILYLYEAWYKHGEYGRIIESIYENYLPMLEAGATTVWESFSRGNIGGDGFPTRSHTHAWSSAPIHFLNAIVLGIQAQAPGGREVAISPALHGLEWAKGATATAQGPVEVEWRREGNALRIAAKAPQGVTLHYVPNPSHEGLSVEFNGQPAGQ